jgi:hypothetical protein
MFYTDGKLQFPVRVDTPDPLFARALQQAIGGVEGEICVAMQYFQACGARSNPKFRNLFMNAAAEELGHIEILATAVALNLEGAPVSIKDEIAADPVASAVLGGLNMKNLLSATPVDSDGLSTSPVDTSLKVGPFSTTSTRSSRAVAVGSVNLRFCRLENQFAPGRHVTDHQLRLFMKYQQTHSVELAAAKVSISRSTAYLLDKETQLPSQNIAPRERPAPIPWSRYSRPRSSRSLRPHPASVPSPSTTRCCATSRILCVA